MSALLDLWHSITGIVLAGDWITLAIMAAIAVATGFAMQNFGSIVTATFAALVLFALATYVRAVATSTGHDAGALARADWHSLLGLSIHNVLAYAIAFAIVISAIHAVRAAVAR